MTTELPQTAPLVTNGEALTTVLRSPLENAIRYADSEVSVAVDAESGGCTVEIHDDGPGIPAGELSALRTDREPQLQHGRGLGLWQLKWGVAELGGEFSITTDDGTTVRMQLPDLDSKI